MQLGIGGVEGEIAAAENIRCIVLPPPEHRTHPSQQLTGGKGLWKIVVRSQIEPGNPVFDLCLRREEKHGGPVTGFPQCAQYREAVHLRHHDIENDPVIVLFACIGEGFGPVINRVHGKIVIFQDIRDSLRHGGFVLGIKKFHAGPPSAPDPTVCREEKRRASARLSTSMLRQFRGLQDTR